MWDIFKIISQQEVTIQSNGKLGLARKENNIYIYSYIMMFASLIEDWSRFIICAVFHVCFLEVCNKIILIWSHPTYVIFHAYLLTHTGNKCFPIDFILTLANVYEAGRILLLQPLASFEENISQGKWNFKHECYMAAVHVVIWFFFFFLLCGTVEYPQWVLINM